MKESEIEVLKRLYNLLLKIKTESFFPYSHEIDSILKDSRDVLRDHRINAIHLTKINGDQFVEFIPMGKENKSEFSETASHVINSEEDLRSESAIEDDERYNSPNQNFVPIQIETWKEATKQVNNILIRLDAINALQSETSKYVENIESTLDKHGDNLKRMDSVIKEIPNIIGDDLETVTKRIFKKRANKLRDELVSLIVRKYDEMKTIDNDNIKSIQDKFNELVTLSNSRREEINNLRNEIELLKNEKKAKRYIKKPLKKPKSKRIKK